jgi:hypothetical protein
MAINLNRIADDINAPLLQRMDRIIELLEIIVSGKWPVDPTKSQSGGQWDTEAMAKSDVEYRRAIAKRGNDISNPVS